MKKVVVMIKKLLAIVLLALLLWGAYVAYALLSSPPAFKAEWGNVTEKYTEMIIQGDWQKPVILPLSVQNVAMKFMNVTVAQTENVKLTEKSANVVLSIDNRNLVLALFKYLDNGQKGTAEISFNGALFRVIPLRFSIKRNVTMDILGKLNFTAESRPVLGGLAYTPALLGTKVSWGGTEKEKGKMIVSMKFYNPNSFPIPLSNLSFSIYANDVKVGTGYLKRSTILPAKGYATAVAIVELDGNRIPEAWALHVKNGETSTIKVQITITTTIMGRTVDIPLKTEQITVKTDIMDQINEALSQISKG